MRDVSKDFWCLCSTTYYIYRDTVIRHWISYMVEFCSLHILFEPSRNEHGEIDECIGCNIEDCYDIHGDGTNKKCKWKNLIDKEAEEMKDDN